MKGIKKGLVALLSALALSVPARGKPTKPANALFSTGYSELNVNKRVAASGSYVEGSAFYDLGIAGRWSVRFKGNLHYDMMRNNQKKLRLDFTKADAQVEGAKVVYSHGNTSLRIKGGARYYYEGEDIKVDSNKGNKHSHFGGVSTGVEFENSFTTLAFNTDVLFGRTDSSFSFQPDKDSLLLDFIVNADAKLGRLRMPVDLRIRYQSPLAGSFSTDDTPKQDGRKNLSMHMDLKLLFEINHNLDFMIHTSYNRVFVGDSEHMFWTAGGGVNARW